MEEHKGKFDRVEVCVGWALTIKSNVTVDIDILLLPFTQNHFYSFECLILTGVSLTSKQKRVITVLIIGNSRSIAPV